MFNDKSDLLTPSNSAIILIDHQPQMLFGVQSADRQTVINNTVGLAKTAKVFQAPIILTTVAANSFSGPLHPQIQEVFPDQKPIDRTSMNSWEDENFLAAVKKTGRKKLIIAALWTEVCLAFPTLSAIKDGYEVYIVTDASAGTTQEAHNMSIQRMIQAGAIPVTWQSVLLEYQRDWARQDTYDSVMEIVIQHGGAYGVGVLYAHTMFGGHEGAV
ncbi:hydrolase [Brevibacillus sp. HB1.2]|uniref:hydrolase n=1 Tax=Brevibacillus TaxID=55080 RepID=UPI000382A3FF|nr:MULTISPECIES: hydrolase [unclassified Brevibacillus]ATF15050.1 hydrolase [Brevibacillus brevis X23]NRS19773.1 hydrolase [Brevibacillus sp. HB1.4B]NTU21925.1 hydrolase [Brevibacillus sp. HB1.2]NTU33052.1 hydrolase [Brevibacillus sp. HB1.1]